MYRMPTRPFEFLGIDLIAMPEAASGNRYAMVVMDHFSRYATVVAIPDKTAITVARALTRQVLLGHGPPNTLLSDQGTEFRQRPHAGTCQELWLQEDLDDPVPTAV